MRTMVSCAKVSLASSPEHFDLMKNSIKSLLKISYFKNILWMFSSEIGRSGIQVIYFILLARQLSAGGYGQFVTAVSYVALLTPLLSFGLGNLFSLHAASDRSMLPYAFGNSLLMSAILGCVYTLAICLVMSFVHNDGTFLKVIFLVAVSDSIFMRIIENSSWLFMAIEKLKYSALIQLYLASLRLICLAALMVFGLVNILSWSIIYVSVTAFTSIIGLIYVMEDLHFFGIDYSLLKLDLRRGVGFSLAAMAQGQYGTIDKILIERFLGFSAVGIYSAAQRVIVLGYMPINAVMASSYAGFFRYGQHGLKNALIYALKISKISVSVGAMSAFTLFFGADLFALVLGNSYKDVSLIIRILSCIPLLQSIYYLYANALTGSGFIKFRTWAYVINICILCVLITFLTAKLAVTGAAISLLFCEISLTIIFYAFSTYALSLQHKLT